MDDSVELILIHELTDGMFDVDVDATVVANIPANSHCYLSGDGVVTPIGADETAGNIAKYLGYTVKPWNYGYDSKLALQTKFRNLVKMVAGGTVTAGMKLMFEVGAGALPGQVIEWDGTDGRCIGMAYTGGADTETIQVLMEW